MQSGHGSPHKILQHATVLVLTTAIVAMEKHFFLTKTMMAEKVMELSNYHICTFSTVSSFVSQKIDLTRNCLTIDAKQATHLRGVRKTIGPGWSGLEGK